MSYTILDRDTLPHDGNTYEFEGLQCQDTEVSFIWVDMPPGGSVRLHQHPYQEIFIIQEGRVTFVVGSATLEAHKVALDMTVSLDGYIAGPHDEVDWGLFDWQLDTKTNTFKHSAAMDELLETTGAIIAGRRVYEGVHGWGGNHPIHGVPVFVLTHDPPKPQEIPEGATPFTFVADGIESALAQATAAAGAKDVYVMGGARI